MKQELQPRVEPTDRLHNQPPPPLHAKHDSRTPRKSGEWTPTPPQGVTRRITTTLPSRPAVPPEWLFQGWELSRARAQYFCGNPRGAREFVTCDRNPSIPADRNERPLHGMDARPVFRGRRDTLSSLGAEAKSGSTLVIDGARSRRHDAATRMASSRPSSRACRRRALSVCAVERTTRSRPGVPLSARRRQRSERGDRSTRLSLARSPGQGREWDDIVLYELHLGAFSPEGTFAGAARKLDHLADLGVTAVEIMPVSDFKRPLELGL